ncbi:methyltransferase domain-containing protein [Patescibacteria group bacterium]|nr:methyltransferase domain-containing protein [Patescibacteria group bacterium]
MSFSIFPRTVYKTESKISGQIEVKEQLGNYTLHVQDLIQSGGIIEGIWKKALRGAQGKLSVSNCLVLGLGGGTVVQLIAGHSARPHFCLCKKVKAQYPGAKIIGIEIDPAIIKIGKKFFSLGKIENLKIVNADAIKWVANYDISYHRSRFDLILVDLYIGRQLSPKVESDEFLKNIEKLLSKNGRIIFNRLISPSEDLAGFEEKLRANFARVEALDLKTNLFLICRP